MNISSPILSKLTSPLCLGTGSWGTSHDGNSDELYQSFRGAGGNAFDSAHCYAFWMDAEGASERRLGELVRRHDRREDVVLCTKGCHPAGGEKYPRPDFYMTPEILNSDLSDSLQRLNTDYVDFYFLHRDDPRIGVDEILDALHEHQQAGRIRHYAASNWRANRLQTAFEYSNRKGIEGFAASQILGNLGQLTHPMAPDLCVWDDTQNAWYDEHQLPIFAYSSTANGFFGATIPDQSSYDNDISRQRRQRAIEMAQKRGATSHQIALAYLMNQPFPIVPVFSTTQTEHLSETMSASSIQLSVEEVRWLRDG